MSARSDGASPSGKGIKLKISTVGVAEPKVVATKPLDLFEGLDLKCGGPAGPRPSSPTRQQPALPKPAHEPTIGRHAKTVQVMRFAQRMGDPYTVAQRAEVIPSRASLDALQPHGSIDVERAFAHYCKLIEEAAKGHTAKVLSMVQLEGEMVRRWS